MNEKLPEVNPTGRTSSVTQSQAGLLFAIVCPTLLTFVYFNLLQEMAPAIQQGVYGAGKLLQFGFPAFCFFVLLRGKQTFSLPSRQSVLLGSAFGIVVALVMLVIYWLALRPSGFFDGPGQQVREKIAGMGIDSWMKYAALGLFYAIVHSFLEEYYWRWFVFRQLRITMPQSAAVWISSLGFMAHHVIVLKTFFGWDSPATYLFSASVAIGGAAWAWLYERSGSLAGPWLSHLLVDAGIFIIGYDLAHEFLHG